MINFSRLKKEEILWLAKNRCRHHHTYLEHIKCAEREKKDFREVIGFLDIEASNLNADFGIIFSWCIKKEGGKNICEVVSPEDLKNGYYDKNIIKKFNSEVRNFDRLVVYYGTDNRFDLPTLRTRAVFWKTDFPLYKSVKVTDVYPIIKRKFNLHRNRLETACEFFGIACKKHRLKPEIWFKAQAGNKKALNFILLHNKEDTISLELLYNRVKDYANITDSSI